jgi:hypothetical protein
MNHNGSRKRKFPPCSVVLGSIPYMVPVRHAMARNDKTAVVTVIIKLRRHLSRIEIIHL